MINIVGAFLLGILLGRWPGAAGHRPKTIPPDAGGYRVHGRIHHLQRAGHRRCRPAVVGITGGRAAYGVGTVIVGAIATWTGIAVGTHPPHRRRRPMSRECSSPSRWPVGSVRCAGSFSTG